YVTAAAPSWTAAHWTPPPHPDATDEVVCGEFPTAPPLPRLADRLRQFELESCPGLPPFQAGLAGLFGYGLGRAFERLPLPRSDPFWVPDLAVGIYDWVVSFDHSENRAWVLSTGFP